LRRGRTDVIRILAYYVGPDKGDAGTAMRDRDRSPAVSEQPEGRLDVSGTRYETRRHPERARESREARGASRFGPEPRRQGWLIA
jgi:hypothetical protein